MKKFRQQPEVDLLHGPIYFRYWSFNGQKVTRSFTIPTCFHLFVKDGGDLHSVFRGEIYRVVDALKSKRSFYDSLVSEWEEYSCSEKYEVLIDAAYITSRQDMSHFETKYPWYTAFYDLMYEENPDNGYPFRTDLCRCSSDLYYLKTHLLILCRLIIIAITEGE